MIYLILYLVGFFISYGYFVTLDNKSLNPNYQFCFIAALIWPLTVLLLLGVGLAI